MSTDKDQLELSYLAGAIDSDGCISIRRSTYQLRKGIDGTKNPTFTERLTIKQVSNIIPQMMADRFGGKVKRSKGGSANSKDLYSYDVANRIANRAITALFPYLRLKKEQANCCIELRRTHESQFKQHSYWYAIDNPDWRNTEIFVSTLDASDLLDYANRRSVLQAIEAGTLLALPAKVDGRVISDRVPLGLIEILNERGNSRPPQLIDWRQRLHDRVRELNKIGITGTSVYHRRGCHRPKPAVAE